MLNEVVTNELHRLDYKVTTTKAFSSYLSQ